MSHRLEALIQRNRAVKLKNMTCPYCGGDLSAQKKTKDHVIGRNFVPKGMLDQQWNLVLAACARCNLQKSELEDDISAITAALHGNGLHGMDDQLLQQESRRRAHRSISRKTGRRVIDSAERIKFEAPLSKGISISGDFTAPPQLEESRAYELARLQMAGFFYMLTYQPEQKKGFFWPHGFHPLHCTHRPDWGNTLHLDFMNAVRNWDYRLILIAANGYYKAMLRRHPEAECWAWAIEWNKAYRVLGFIGERDAAQEIAKNLREPKTHRILATPEHTIRFREERPISEDNDILFAADSFDRPKT